MLGTSLQKRLRMETLEEKVPLASDFSVNLVDGDLVIVADGNPSSMALALFIENGDKFYRVIAEEPGDTMTFNGVPVTNGTPTEGPSVLVSGVTRDIRIDLGDGNDMLYVLGEYTLVGDDAIVETYVPRDLVIDLGGGDDFLSVGIPGNIIDNQHLSPAAPLGVGRDLVITGGQGNDTAFLSALVIGDDISITDSEGDNLIEFYSKEFFVEDPGAPGSTPLFDTLIGDDLSITTGSGADAVGTASLIVEGDITVNTGAGDDIGLIQAFDTAGSVLINAGAGFNDVSIRDASIGGGVMITGSGANLFQIGDVDVASSIVMLTNNNDDQLFMSATTAGSAIISSGGGSDYVQLTDSAFDLLTVSLGSGNDTLYMDSITSTLAILLGGGGTDTLQESADTSFLMALKLSFELIDPIVDPEEV